MPSSYVYNYDNIWDVITDLIDNYADGVHINDNLQEENRIEGEKISGAALDGFIKNKDTFWYYLLEYLNSEKKYLFHSGIMSEDFFHGKDDFVGFFEYINEKADIDDNKFEKIKTAIRDEELGASFWNESIQELVKKYINSFDYQTLKNIETDLENAIGTIPMGEGKVKFKITDLIDSDAGNSFHQDEEWVKPWTNIDEESYSIVRNIDKIISTLTNNRELQYTMEKDYELNSGKVRLLMPKYLRRVEVEDLDRNFWVIGQTLSGISSFLFNPDSPIYSLLDSMIDEILGLWENVFYLWVILSQLTFKSTYETKFIYIPLPNTPEMQYRKFDNFYRASSYFDEEIEDRISYLIDQYDDKNLLILPEIRINNYFKNYYSGVKYLGLYYYNRKSKQWTVYRESDDNGNPIEWAIDLKNGFKNLGNICETDDKYIILNKNDYDKLEDSTVYFRMLRLHPQLEELEMDEDLQISSCKINIFGEDVAADIENVDNRLVNIFSIKIENGEIETEKITETGIAISTVTRNKNKGFYQGEVLSYYNLTPAELPDFITPELQVKVVSYRDGLIDIFDRREEYPYFYQTTPSDSSVQREINGISHYINANLRDSDEENGIVAWGIRGDTTEYLNLSSNYNSLYYKSGGIISAFSDLNSENSRIKDWFEKIYLPLHADEENYFYLIGVPMLSPTGSGTAASAYYYGYIRMEGYNISRYVFITRNKDDSTENLIEELEEIESLSSGEEKQKRRFNFWNKFLVTDASPAKEGGISGRRCFYGTSNKSSTDPALVNPSEIGIDGEPTKNWNLIYPAYKALSNPENEDSLSVKSEYSGGITTTRTNLQVSRITTNKPRFDEYGQIELNGLINDFYSYNLDRYTFLFYDGIAARYDGENTDFNWTDFQLDSKWKDVTQSSVIWRRKCRIDLEKGRVYWNENEAPIDEISRVPDSNCYALYLNNQEEEQAQMLPTSNWEYGNYIAVSLPNFNKERELDYLDTINSETIQTSYNRLYQNDSEHMIENLIQFNIGNGDLE